jgi:hypothetical protein
MCISQRLRFYPCIETDARLLTVLMSYVGSAGCAGISKSGRRSASLAAMPA